MILSHFTPEPFTLDLDRTYGALRLPMKPHGLWLSDESDHGWAKWCRDENIQTERLAHETRFTIKPEANVLHLGSAPEVFTFTREYTADHHDRYGVFAIDWARVANEYDGILITPYQHMLRLEVETLWYSGWDVASACIWNLAVLASES